MTVNYIWFVHLQNSFFFIMLLTVTENYLALVIYFTYISTWQRHTFSRGSSYRNLIHQKDLSKDYLYLFFYDYLVFFFSQTTKLFSPSFAKLWLRNICCCFFVRFKFSCNEWPYWPYILSKFKQLWEMGRVAGLSPIAITCVLYTRVFILH